MNKIIIITSSSLRHMFFAKTLIDSLSNYKIQLIIEGNVLTDFLYKESSLNEDIITKHFNLRFNSEIDFFMNSEKVLKYNLEIINIEKGDINNENSLDFISKFNPNLIITYGCSIIKPKLIGLFKNRIINVHLGLSPYYKGAGTNFHALVNNKFELMGYSFIYMDEGIDTGEIIHQSRAKFNLLDSPHTAGNRLIKSMTFDMIKLIKNFKLIESKKQLKILNGSKIFRKSDANRNKTLSLYKNFTNNLNNYLNSQKIINNEYPIIRQKFFKT